MNKTTANVDPDEIEQFGALAARWWDPESEFKPLHEINPLRLGLVDDQCQLTGKKVLDVGCGGGILSESMAERGADVLGIDMGKAVLMVAKLHQLDSGVPVEYRQCTVEELADEQPEQYDIVTCMEMIEHVPDPASVVAACARLTKPGGDVFLSTINRNPKSYLFAILGAEYLLNLLPKGTHDYEKFVRPSEMNRWARQAGLDCVAVTGMTYNPLTKIYRLGKDVDVNYISQFHKPHSN